MRYLLNAAYIAIFLLATPWLILQSIRTGKYREGWSAKLFGRVTLLPSSTSPGSNAKPVIWLHAVSVGEVNLLATFLRQLVPALPGHQFYITTTTRTGYALAKKRFTEHTVSYAPLDFSWAVSSALKRIQPVGLVLVELELWPNLIRMASENGVKVAIVNGRLSENSFGGYSRLERWTSLPSRMLQRVGLVAVQNEEYASRFRDLGADPVVTGSMKFDGAVTDRANQETRRLAEVGGYHRPHSPMAGQGCEPAILIAGSTQDPEESLALATYLELRESHPNLRLIVVPRHPERFDEVAEICQAAPVRFQRRSEISGGLDQSAEVLLVDTVGELSAWWGLADIAFVGGSMGSRGGQNMIEPAAFGAAVSFGPNTKNFRDVTSLLIQGDAAKVVNDGEELTAFVKRCLDDPSFANNLGANARRLVDLQKGATRDTVSRLKAFIQGENRVSNRVA